MIFTNIVRRYLSLAPAVPPSQIYTAYHKSGHILLAYSYGYSCHRADLKGIDNIDIHFKDDLMLVAGITSYSMDPVLFDSLPDHHKKRASLVTGRLISMMTAGYLAQKRSEFGDQCLFKAGEDLLQHPPASIDRLQQFLDHWNRDEADPFAKTFQVQSLSYMLTRAENWKLVDTLARCLLYAPGNTLDQHQIEKVINKSGVFKYTPRSSYHYSYPEISKFSSDSLPAGSR
jgi:hypothetical protein